MAVTTINNDMAVHLKQGAGRKFTGNEVSVSLKASWTVIGGVEYEAIFSDEFSEAVEKLDNAVHEMVKKRLVKIISSPKLGKPLHGEANLFAERLGGLRIIYRIEGRIILFLRIGKRGEVYR